MKRLIKVNVYIFLLGLISNPAYSQQENLVYRPFGEIIGFKAYEIELSASQFSSTSRIDEKGVEQVFINSQDFLLQEGNMTLRYGIGDKLEVRLGSRFRGIFNTTIVGEQVQNIGIDSVLAGIKYKLDKKVGSPWNFSLDAQLRQSSHSNSDYVPGTAPIDVVVLGDSGNTITAGVSFSRMYGTVTHFNLYTAFNLPPNSQSQEILYDSQNAFAWTKWALVFGVEGIYSLKTDDFYNDAISKPAVSRGETYLFNSINREFAAPYFMINKAFTKWKIGFKARSIVMGVSTDLGTEMGIYITWNSQGVTFADRKIGKFKEYDIEATVIKISPRGKFIKIDHGLSHDIDKGSRFDIFQSDYFGGNVLVGYGVVYQVGADWAIIKLLKKYADIKIIKGFTARGY